MSHVWIVNHYASRPGESGQRHFALAKRLVEYGWTASVIACGAQHYTGVQRVRGFRMSLLEDHEGVRFLWLRMPSYRANGVVRLLNMLGFFFMVVLGIGSRRLKRPDAIVGSTVHPLAALAAYRLSLKYRVPFIFEIRDLWPETLVELGSLRRESVVARLMYRLELHLCKKAASVVTTMPFGADYLSGKGVDKAKVHWISNGVTVDEFESSPPKSRTYGSSLLFTYYGALGGANCVDLLVKGFARAELPCSSKLLIYGSGPCSEGLADLVEELGLRSRVELAGSVSRNDIPAISVRADVLVVALRDSPLYRFGISLNKLFEYMASGRPILFAGAARGNPVASSGGAVVCAAEVSSIASGFERISQLSSGTMEEMGERNRAYARQNFDFRSLAGKFAGLLDASIR